MLPDDEEGEVMVGEKEWAARRSCSYPARDSPVIRRHPIFGTPSAEPASFTRPFVPPHANPTPCLPFQLHQHKITALQPALIQELPRSSSVYS